MERDPGRRASGGRAPAPAGCDALVLAQAHLAALYVRDARGRLLAVAGPCGEPAAREGSAPLPRFHLFRTRLGNVWRFGASLDGRSVRRLATLAAREAPLALDARGEAPPPERLEFMRRALAATGPVSHLYAGPAFAFPPEATRRRPAAARQVELGDADVGRLAPALGHQATRLGVAEAVGVEVDGRVVALCRSARGAPGAAVEAGVETAPAWRGRGHGAAALAGWAERVRRSGRVPLFSTTWENVAARALARRLGLRLYGEDLHLG